MKQVVIVGGGYGGVAAFQKLSKRRDINTLLIDKHPYHFLQTEGYSLIAGKKPFDQTLVNLHSLCQSYGTHTSFLHAGVSSIDLEQKCVLIDDKEEIDYDYLIIATGSVTRFMKSIEGLQNSSYGIKNLRGAFHMKQFFEKELLTRLENDKHAKDHYSVVVGGGGLSGVEIAAEMQHYFNRYYKSNTLGCDRLNIHLISGSPTVLKGMHPKIIEKAEQRLETLGVNLHCGEHIVKVEPHKAVLEDGEVIHFDFMIFTGGIMGASMIKDIEVEHNKIGQIIVAPDLQISGKPGVFAIGDAADITDKAGNRVPDTAQAAIKSGQCAADNIVLLMEGKKTLPAEIKVLGLAIAMGGHSAILSVGNMRIYGIVAYLFKNIVENLYKWPLWLRCHFAR